MKRVDGARRCRDQGDVATCARSGQRFAHIDERERLIRARDSVAGRTLCRPKPAIPNLCENRVIKAN